MLKGFSQLMLATFGGEVKVRGIFKTARPSNDDPSPSGQTQRQRQCKGPQGRQPITVGKPDSGKTVHEQLLFGKVARCNKDKLGWTGDGKADDPSVKMTTRNLIPAARLRPLHMDRQGSGVINPQTEFQATRRRAGKPDTQQSLLTARQIPPISSPVSALLFNQPRGLCRLNTAQAFIQSKRGRIMQGSTQLRDERRERNRCDEYSPTYKQPSDPWSTLYPHNSTPLF